MTVNRQPSTADPRVPAGNAREQCGEVVGARSVDRPALQVLRVDTREPRRMTERVQRASPHSCPRSPPCPGPRRPRRPGWQRVPRAAAVPPTRRRPTTRRAIRGSRSARTARQRRTQADAEERDPEQGRRQDEHVSRVARRGRCSPGPPTPAPTGPSHDRAGTDGSQRPRTSGMRPERGGRKVARQAPTRPSRRPPTMPSRRTHDVAGRFGPAPSLPTVPRRPTPPHSLPRTNCSAIGPRSAWAIRPTRLASWAPYNRCATGPPPERQYQVEELAPSRRGEQHRTHRVVAPARITGDALMAVVDGQRPGQRKDLVPREVAHLVAGLLLVALQRFDPRREPGHSLAEQLLHHEVEPEDASRGPSHGDRRGEIPVEDGDDVTRLVEDEVAEADVAPEKHRVAFGRAVTRAPVERLGERRERVALRRPFDVARPTARRRRRGAVRPAPPPSPPPPTAPRGSRPAHR